MIFDVKDAGRPSCYTFHSSKTTRISIFFRFPYARPEKTRTNLRFHPKIIKNRPWALQYFHSHIEQTDQRRRGQKNAQQRRRQQRRRLSLIGVIVLNTNSMELVVVFSSSSTLSTFNIRLLLSVVCIIMRSDALLFLMC